MLCKLCGASCSLVDLENHNISRYLTKEVFIYLHPEGDKKCKFLNKYIAMCDKCLDISNNMRLILGASVLECTKCRTGWEGITLCLDGRCIDIHSNHLPHQCLKCKRKLHGDTLASAEGQHCIGWRNLYFTVGLKCAYPVLYSLHYNSGVHC